MSGKKPVTNSEEDSDGEEPVVVLDEEIIDRNVPVDRGYAWIILAASVAMMITVNGSGRSFGIFFVELLKEFNATSSMISFLLGAQFTAYSMSVFWVLNYLTELTTHRTLILIGAVFCTTTFILDSVSPSVELLILAHIIQGVGFAFTFGPNVVIVGHYFKKYRGSANAIATCGSSLGQFCLSPLFSFLIWYYGVRGALLIQAGLMLNCLVFASLLRPTDFFRKRALRKTFLNADSTSMRKDEEEAIFSSNNSIIISPAITVSTSSTKNNSHNNNIATNSTKHTLGGEENNCKQFPRQIKTLLSESPRRRESCQSSPELLPMLEAKGVVSIDCDIINKCGRGNRLESDTIHYQNKRPLISDSMLGFGSMVSLQDISRRNSQIKAMRYLRENSLIGASLPEPPPASQPNQGTSLRKLAKKMFMKFDLNLLKYKLYLVFLFGYNFGCCGSSTMHVYFPSHVQDMGLSREKGMFIVSLSGLADLSGRVIMSIIADRLCMQRSHLVSFITLLNGAACCCVPLITTFYWYAAYSVLYGLSSGIFFSCITSVLTDFIGLHKLAKGLGMGFLLHGLSASFAFPLQGLLRDTFGSYTAGFILNGVSLIASGILFALAPYARKLDTNARKARHEVNG